MVPNDMSMEPWERLHRLLQWCRLSGQPEEWDHITAERCRQLLPQIAVDAVSLKLPVMFRVPLARFLDGDPTISEVINDDDRLLLMLSDMQDYLTLKKWGYR